jgi:hypothetical protein
MAMNTGKNLLCAVLLAYLVLCGAFDPSPAMLTHLHAASVICHYRHSCSMPTAAVMAHPHRTIS